MITSAPPDTLLSFHSPRYQLVNDCQMCSLVLTYAFFFIRVFSSLVPVRCSVRMDRYPHDTKDGYKKWILLVCSLIIVIITFLALIFVLRSVFFETQAPETLYATFSQAIVVSSATPCATIGKDILKKRGNAVDAAIATMLCEGVVLPYATGLGGGFLMIVYNKTYNNFTTMNARETAPSGATVNMYHGNSNISQKGGFSVAIPGTMKGLWTAYHLFGGGVSWEELLMPSVKLCEQGVPINEYVLERIQQKREVIEQDPEFKQLFMNPKTGQLLEEGDTYKNLKLARTLRTLITEGGDAIYNGSLSANLARDIQEAGGIITEEDLKNYRVVIEKPFEAPLGDGNFTLYSLQPPASGAILAFILRILAKMLPASDELITTQRITEAFKFAFAARGELGDHNFVNVSSILDKILSDDFISLVRRRIHDTRTWNTTSYYMMNAVGPDDKGTANLAVLSETGDAVVATSTLNTGFGSEVISKSTGIILNDEMDDFSFPDIVNYFGVTPSKMNLIEPGKRPMSSMCPSIITDDVGRIKLLIGGAGGTQITTSVAISAARNLFLNENIRVAMDQVFFHHQLLPMTWMYYPNAPKLIVDGMKKIGHEVETLGSKAVVNGIQIDGNNIHGSCDRSRPGQIDGY